MGLSRGGVGTLMSNFGMEQALRRRAFVSREPKWVIAMCLEDDAQRGWSVGWEASGPYYLWGPNDDRRWHYCRLQVMAAMRSGEILLTLKSGMHKFRKRSSMCRTQPALRSR